MGRHFLRDVRYAFVALRRRPGFTAVAVLVLSLGIGATTAIFSAIDSLLLRPVAFDRPEQLVALTPRLKSGHLTARASYPQYRDLVDRNRVLSGLAAVALQDFRLDATGQGEEDVHGAFVSNNYFQLLGTRPLLGRYFVPVAQPAEGNRGVVLSYGLWQRRFAGERSALGRIVRVNGQPLIVLGVAPEDFTANRVGLAPEFWVPVALAPALTGNMEVLERGQFWLDLVARMRDGVSQSSAAVQLSRLIREIEADNPTPLGFDAITLEPLGRVPVTLRGAVWGFVGLLAVATLAVLLIACVNVGGMMLVYVTGRRREIAVRLAVGADRHRVVTQLVTEGLVLFGLGAVLGLVLAAEFAHLLVAVHWPLPVALDFHLDTRVLAFALSIACVSGIGFSLMPALRVSRPGILPALHGVADSPDLRAMRLRRTFVAGQLALSLLLLVGAGLLFQALQRASAIDLGFNPYGVVVASLDLTGSSIDSSRGPAFYRELVDRVRAIPGVEAVAVGSTVQFGGLPRPMCGQVTGSSGGLGSSFLCVEFNAVGGDYFRALQMALVRGRPFTEVDGPTAPKVAIVNETMAHRLWPGSDPIGQVFGQDPDRVRIIGVVQDAKYQSLVEAPQPYLYVPFAQHYSPSATLHTRVRGALAPVVASLRNELRVLGPSIPAARISSLPDLIAKAIAPQRIGAVLLGVFGLIGLLLSATGLYGIMAYTTAQRTREIGVRMALGAKPGDVLRLVLRQGMTLAAIGVVLGLVLAIATTRLLGHMLYGVSTTEPLTFVTVPALLVAVALLATFIPARRATRVNPSVALRSE